MEGAGVQPPEQPESHYVLPVPRATRDVLPGPAPGRGLPSHGTVERPVESYHPVPLPRIRQGQISVAREPTEDVKKRRSWPWYYPVAFLIFVFGYSGAMIWAQTLVINDWFGITYTDDNGDLDIKGQLFAENLGTTSDVYFGNDYSELGSLQFLSSENKIVSDTASDLTIQAYDGNQIVFQAPIDLQKHTITIEDLQFSGSANSISYVGPDQFSISSPSSVDITASDIVRVTSENVVFTTAEAAIQVDGAVESRIVETGAASIRFDGPQISNTEGLTVSGGSSLSVQASTININSLALTSSSSSRRSLLADDGYLHLTASQPNSDISITAGGDGAVVFVDGISQASDGSPQYLEPHLRIQDSAIYTPEDLTVSASGNLNLNAPSQVSLTSTSGDLYLTAPEVLITPGSGDVLVGSLVLSSTELQVVDTQTDLVVSAAGDIIFLTPEGYTTAVTTDDVPLRVQDTLLLAADGTSVAVTGAGTFSAPTVALTSQTSSITASASAGLTSLVGSTVSVGLTTSPESSLSVSSDLAANATSLSVTSAGGSVLLSAPGSAGTVNVASTGSLSMTTTNAPITFSGSNTVTINAGSATFSVSSATVTASSGTAQLTGASSLSVTAAADSTSGGDLSVSGATGVSMTAGSGGARVYATSSGVSLSSGVKSFVEEDNDVNVVASTVTVTSTKDVLLSLDTNTTYVDLNAAAGATFSAVGAVGIAGSTLVNLNVKQLDATATGDISLTAGGALTLTGSGATFTSTTSNLMTTSLGGDLTSRSGSLSVDGSVVGLQADDQVILRAKGALTATTTSTATLSAATGASVRANGNVDLAAGTGMAAAVSAQNAFFNATNGVAVSGSAVTLTATKAGSSDFSTDGSVAFTGASNVAMSAQAFQAIAGKTSLQLREGALLLNATTTVALEAVSMSLNAKTAAFLIDSTSSTSLRTNTGDLSVTSTGLALNATAGTNTLTAGGQVHLSGSALSFQSQNALNVSSSGDHTITGSKLTVLSGSDVQLSAPKGNVTLQASAGTVQLTANNVAANARSVTFAAKTDLDLNSAGDLIYEGGFSDVAMNTNGTLSVSTNGFLGLRAPAGTASLQSSSTVQLAGTGAFTAKADKANFQANNVQILTSGGGLKLNSNTGAATFAASSGDLTLTSGGTYDISLNAGLGATFVATQGLTFDATGAFTATATSGEISLNAATTLTSTAASHTLKAAGAANLYTSGASGIQIDATGDAVLTAADELVFEAAGSLNLNSTASSVYVKSRPDYVGYRDASTLLGSNTGDIGLSAVNDVNVQAGSGLSIKSSTSDVVFRSTTDQVSISSDKDTSVLVASATTLAATSNVRMAATGGLVFASGATQAAEAGSAILNANSALTVSSNVVSVSTASGNAHVTTSGALQVSAVTGINATSTNAFGLSADAGSITTSSNANAVNLNVARDATFDSSAALNMASRTNALSMNAGSGSIVITAPGSFDIAASAFTLNSTSTSATLTDTTANGVSGVTISTATTPLRLDSRKGGVTVRSSSDTTLTANTSPISFSSSGADAKLTSTSHSVTLDATNATLISAGTGGISFRTTSAAQTVAVGDISLRSTDIITLSSTNSFNATSREGHVAFSAPTTGSFGVTVQSTTMTHNAGTLYEAASTKVQYDAPIINIAGSSLGSLVLNSAGVAVNVVNNPATFTTTRGAVSLATDGAASLSAGSVAVQAATGYVSVTSTGALTSTSQNVTLTAPAGDLRVAATGQGLLIGTQSSSSLPSVSNVNIRSAHVSVSAGTSDITLSSTGASTYTSQTGDVLVQSLTKDLKLTAGSSSVASLQGAAGTQVTADDTIALIAATTVPKTLVSGDIYVNGAQGVKATGANQVNLSSTQGNLLLTSTASNIQTSGANILLASEDRNVTLTATTSATITAPKVALTAGADSAARGHNVPLPTVDTTGDLELRSTGATVMNGTTGVSLTSGNGATFTASGAIVAHALADVTFTAGTTATLTAGTGASVLASTSASFSGQTTVSITSGSDTQVVGKNAVRFTSSSGLLSGGSLAINDAGFSVAAGSSIVSLTAPQTVTFDSATAQFSADSALAVAGHNVTLATGVSSFSSEGVTLTSAGNFVATSNATDSSSPTTKMSLVANSGDLTVAASGSLSVSANTDIVMAAGNSAHSGAIQSTTTNTLGLVSSTGSTQLTSVGGTTPSVGGISLYAAPSTDSTGSDAPVAQPGSIAMKAGRHFNVGSSAYPTQVTVAAPSNIDMVASGDATFSATGTVGDVNMLASSVLATSSTNHTTLHTAQGVVVTSGNLAVTPVSQNVQLQSSKGVYVGGAGLFDVQASNANLAVDAASSITFSSTTGNVNVNAAAAGLTMQGQRRVAVDAGQNVGVVAKGELSATAKGGIRLAAGFTDLTADESDTTFTANAGNNTLTYVAGTGVTITSAPSSGSADLAVAAPAGALDVLATLGTVTLSSSTGAIDIVAAQSNTTVQAVGAVTVTSSGTLTGSVEVLSGSAGQASLHATTGGIYLAANTAAATSLTAEAGTVRVHAPLTFSMTTGADLSMTASANVNVNSNADAYFTGYNKVTLEAANNLVASAPAGSIRLDASKPTQEVPIASAYVKNNICYVTTTLPHNLRQGEFVLISNAQTVMSGSSDITSAYKGDHEVLVVTAPTEFRFELVTSNAVLTATNFGSVGFYSRLNAATSTVNLDVNRFVWLSAPDADVTATASNELTATSSHAVRLESADAATFSTAGTTYLTATDSDVMITANNGALFSTNPSRTSATANAVVIDSVTEMKFQGQPLTVSAAQDVTFSAAETLDVNTQGFGIFAGAASSASQLTSVTTGLGKILADNSVTFDSPIATGAVSFESTAGLTSLVNVTAFDATLTAPTVDITANSLNHVASHGGVTLRASTSGVGMFVNAASSAVADGQIVIDAVGDAKLNATTTLDLVAATTFAATAAADINIQAGNLASVTASQMLSIAGTNTITAHADKVHLAATVGDVTLRSSGDATFAATGNINIDAPISKGLLLGKQLLQTQSNDLTVNTDDLSFTTKIVYTDGMSPAPNVELVSVGDHTVHMTGKASLSNSDRGMIFTTKQSISSAETAADTYDHGQTLFEAANTMTLESASNVNIIAESADGASTTPSLNVVSAKDATLTASNGPINLSAGGQLTMDLTKTSATAFQATAGGNVEVTAPNAAGVLEVISHSKGMLLNAEPSAASVSSPTDATVKARGQYIQINKDIASGSLSNVNFLGATSAELHATSDVAITASTFSVSASVSTFSAGTTVNLVGQSASLVSTSSALIQAPTTGSVTISASGSATAASTGVSIAGKNVEVSTYSFGGTGSNSVSLSSTSGDVSFSTRSAVYMQSVNDLGLMSTSGSITAHASTAAVSYTAETDVLFKNTESTQYMSITNNNVGYTVVGSTGDLVVSSEGVTGIELKSTNANVVNTMVRSMGSATTDNVNIIASGSGSTAGITHFTVGTGSSLYGADLRLSDTSMQFVTSSNLELRGKSTTIISGDDLQLQSAADITFQMGGVDNLRFHAPSTKIVSDISNIKVTGGGCLASTQTDQDPTCSSVLTIQVNGTASDLTFNTLNNDNTTGTATETVFQGAFQLVNSSSDAVDNKFYYPDALTNCRDGEIRWASNSAGNSSIFVCIDSQNVQEKWRQVKLTDLESYTLESVATEFSYGGMSTADVTNQTTFASDFSSMIAAQLGIDPSNVVVTGLRDGSLIVTFQIIPDADSDKASNSATIKSSLQELYATAAANPSSTDATTNPLMNFRSDGANPSTTCGTATTAGKPCLDTATSLGGTNANLQFFTNALPYLNMSTNSLLLLEGTQPSARAIYITDVEDDLVPVNAYTVTVSSSNTTVIPSANLVLTKLTDYTSASSPTSYSLAMTVATTGSTTITVTVKDSNSGTSTASFTVTTYGADTNTAPTIDSKIGDQSVSEDTVITGLVVSLNDTEDPFANLWYYATYEMLESSDALNPSGIYGNPPNRDLGLTFSYAGSGKDRTLGVSIAPNRYGIALVTIVAQDSAGKNDTDTFRLSVKSVIDSPTVTPIDDRTFNEDQLSGSFQFTVTNVENIPADVTFAVASTNDVVPAANVIFDRYFVLPVQDCLITFQDLRPMTAAQRGYTFVVRCPYECTVSNSSTTYRLNTARDSFDYVTPICGDLDSTGAAWEHRLLSTGLYRPSYEVTLVNGAGTFGPSDATQQDFANDLEAGDVVVLSADYMTPSTTDMTVTILEVTSGLSGSVTFTPALSVDYAGPIKVSRAIDRTLIVVKNNINTDYEATFSVYPQNAQVPNTYEKPISYIPTASTAEYSSSASGNSPMKVLTLDSGVNTDVLSEIRVGATVRAFRPTYGVMTATRGSNILIAGSPAPDFKTYEFKPQDLVMVNGEVRNVTAVDKTAQTITVDHEFLITASAELYYSTEDRTIVSYDTTSTTKTITVDYPFPESFTSWPFLIYQENAFSILDSSQATPVQVGTTSDSCFLTANEIAETADPVYSATCTTLDTDAFGLYPTNVSVMVRCPQNCLSTNHKDASGLIGPKTVTGSGKLTLLSTGGYDLMVSNYTVTSASASGGRAYITVSGNDFATGDVVVISGASFLFAPELDSSFNAAHTITKYSNGTMTFAYSYTFDSGRVRTLGVAYTLRGIQTSDQVTVYVPAATTRVVSAISGSKITLTAALTGVVSGSYSYESTSLRTLVSSNSTSVFSNNAVGDYIHINGQESRQISAVVSTSEILVSTPYAAKFTSTNWRYSKVPVVGGTDRGSSYTWYDRRVFETGTAICSAALLVGAYSDTASDPYARMFIYTARKSVADTSAPVADLSVSTAAGYITPTAAQGNTYGFVISDIQTTTFDDSTTDFYAESEILRLARDQSAGNTLLVTCPAVDCSASSGVSYYIAGPPDTNQLNKLILKQLPILNIKWNKEANRFLLTVSAEHNFQSGMTFNIKGQSASMDLCLADNTSCVAFTGFTETSYTMHVTNAIFKDNTCTFGSDLGKCISTEIEVEVSMPESGLPLDSDGVRQGQVVADAYGYLESVLDTTYIQTQVQSAKHSIWSAYDASQVQAVFGSQIVLQTPLSSYISVSGYSFGRLKIYGSVENGYSSNTAVCQAAWEAGLITSTSTVAERTLALSYRQTSESSASLTPPSFYSAGSERGFTLWRPTVVDTTSTRDSAVWVRFDGSERRIRTVLANNVHGDSIVTLTISNSIGAEITETYRVQVKSKPDGLTVVSDSPSGNEYDTTCTLVNNQCAIPLQIFPDLLDTDGSEKLYKLEFVFPSDEYSMVVDGTTVSTTAGTSTVSVTDATLLSTLAAQTAVTGTLQFVPPRNFPAGTGSSSTQFTVTILGYSQELDTLTSAAGSSWLSYVTVTPVADGPIVGTTSISGKQNPNADAALDFSVNVTFALSDTDGSETINTYAYIRDVPYGSYVLDAASTSYYVADSDLYQCESFAAKYIDWSDSTSNCDNTARWSNSTVDMSKDTTSAVWYIRCPPGCAVTGSTVLKGNMFYTDDSSVCMAAIHAGVFPAVQGGVVRLIKRSGSIFSSTLNPGATYNDVTAAAYPDNYNSGLAFLPDSINFVDSYEITAFDVINSTAVTATTAQRVVFSAGDSILISDATSATFTDSVSETLTNVNNTLVTVLSVASNRLSFVFTPTTDTDAVGALTPSGSVIAMASSGSLLCQKHNMTRTQITEPANLRMTEHGSFNLTMQGWTTESANAHQQSSSSLELTTVRPYGDEPFLTVGLHQDDDTDAYIVVAKDYVAHKTGIVNGLVNVFIELGDTFLELKDDGEVLSGISISQIPTDAYLYYQDPATSDYVRVCPQVRVQSVKVVSGTVATIKVASGSYIAASASDGSQDEYVTLSSDTGIVNSAGTAVTIAGVFKVLNDASDSDSTTWNIDITASTWGTVTGDLSSAANGASFGWVYCGTKIDAVSSLNNLLTFYIPRSIAYECLYKGTDDYNTDIKNCRTSTWDDYRSPPTHLSSRIVFPRFFVAMISQPNPNVLYLQWRGYSVEPSTCSTGTIDRGCDVYATRLQVQQLTVYLFNAPPLFTTSTIYLTEDAEPVSLSGYSNFNASVDALGSNDVYMTAINALTGVSSGNIYEDKFQYPFSQSSYTTSCNNTAVLVTDALLMNPTMYFKSGTSQTADQTFYVKANYADDGQAILCTTCITDSGIDAVTTNSVNGPQTTCNNFYLRILPIPDKPVWTAPITEWVIDESSVSFFTSVSPSSGAEVKASNPFNEQIEKLIFSNYPSSGSFQHGYPNVVGITGGEMTYTVYQDRLQYNSIQYSDADFTMTVTAYAVQTGRSGVYNTTNQVVPVRVRAVANAPTVTAAHLTVNEESTFALRVTPTLTDRDGSEKLTQVKLQNLRSGVLVLFNGQTLSAATDNSVTLSYNSTSTYFTSGAKVVGLSMVLPEDDDTDFTLTVTATSEELSTEVQSSTSQYSTKTATSTTVAIPLTVNPVADVPRVQAAGRLVTEDVRCRLSVTPFLASTAGSERFKLLSYSNLPAGATLLINGTSETYTAASGDILANSRFVHAQQLIGLSVLPATHSAADFTMTWSVQVEVATNTQLTAYSSTVAMPITLYGDADTPNISVPTATADLTTVEDSCKALLLSGSVIDTATETPTFTLALTTHDGDSTYATSSLVDLYSGSSSCASGNMLTPASAGVWSISSTQLTNGLYMKLKTNVAASADWVWTVTAWQTSNSDTAVSTRSFTVAVSAVADAPTVDAASATSGFENAPIALKVTPSLVDTDGSETINKVTVSLSGTSTPRLSLGGSTTTTFPAVFSTTFTSKTKVPGLSIQPVSRCDSDFTLTFTFQTQENAGSTSTATQSKEMAVTVYPVGDKPTLGGNSLTSDQSVLEDGCYNLQLSGTLADVDGSETLSLAVTDNWSLSGSTPLKGIYSDSACTSAISAVNNAWSFSTFPVSVYVASKLNTDDDISLRFVLTSTERDVDNSGSRPTASDTQTLTVKVRAVADTPTVAGSPALTTVNERTSTDSTAGIVSFSMAMRPTDTDSSEKIYKIYLSGLASATLIPSSDLTIDSSTKTSDAAAVYALSGSAITPYVNQTTTVTMQVQLLPHVDTNLNLVATAESRESATALDQVSRTAQNGTSTMQIQVIAVPDSPTISGTNLNGVTVDEDACTSLGLSAILVDTDGSESLNVKLYVNQLDTSYLSWSSVKIYSTSSCSSEVTSARVAGANDEASYFQFTSTSATNPLSGLYIKGPVNTDNDFQLSMVVSTSENSAEALAGEKISDPSPTTLTIRYTVLAVADAPTLTSSSSITAKEDTQFYLLLDPTLVDSDGSERLVTLLASGFPTTYSYTSESGVTIQNGQVTIDLSTQSPPFNITLVPPPDSSASFTISVNVTSQESATGSQVKTSSATSNGVSIQIIVYGVADFPTATAASVTGDEDAYFPLSLSASITDDDGSETLQYSLTLLSANPTAITFTSTTFQCNGSTLSGTWTTSTNTYSWTQAQCDPKYSNMTMKLPSNQNGDLSLQFSATAVENAPVLSADQYATTTTSFSVHVNGKPDNPGTATLSLLSGQSCVGINENTALGTDVGTFGAPNDPDLSPWGTDSFTYSLLFQSGSYFTVDSDGTLVTANTNINYEAISNHSISIRVRVTDVNGLTTDTSFNIAVCNVNDVPSDIVFSSVLTLSTGEYGDMVVVENLLDGTVIGTFSAVDEDTADTSFTYKFVDTADFLNPSSNPRFRISGSSITTATSTDYSTWQTNGGTGLYPGLINYEGNVPKPYDSGISIDRSTHLMKNSTTGASIDTTLLTRGMNYSMPIIVYDPSGASYTKTVIITVRDANDAPYIKVADKDTATWSFVAGSQYSLGVPLQVFDEDTAYNNWDHSANLLSLAMSGTTSIFDGSTDGLFRSLKSGSTLWMADLTTEPGAMEVYRYPSTISYYSYLDVNSFVYFSQTTTGTGQLTLSIQDASGASNFVTMTFTLTASTSSQDGSSSLVRVSNIQFSENHEYVL